MRSRLHITLLTATLVASTAGAVAAQVTPPQRLSELYAGDTTLVDRVAAVVGDSVITLSQVDQELRAARAQGQQATPEAVLDRMVELQLILQAAARDTTIVVSDDELDTRVDAQMERVQQQFGSERAFRQALEQSNLTPATYRERIREQARNQRIQSLYMSKQLQEAPAVAVTESEMREFYEERRGSLEERPEVLALEQIFIKPGASDSAWAAAEAEADSLRTELAAGADFAELAREHSDDVGTAEEGGDLGWFRRGLMVREFDQTVFRLRNGQISPPIRTRFGYHIIKKERSRPGEVKARHILIMPELSEEDTRSASDRAAEVARRAREGEAMEDLYEEFGDPDQPLSIQLSRQQVSQLPYPGYAERLADAEEGDLVGPFETRLGGSAYYAVLKVEDIREAGEYTFEDLRDQIRDTLLQQKRVERILQRLRDRTYVDIRM